MSWARRDAARRPRGFASLGPVPVKVSLPSSTGYTGLRVDGYADCRRTRCPRQHHHYHARVPPFLVRRHAMHARRFSRELPWILAQRVPAARQTALFLTSYMCIALLRVGATQPTATPDGLANTDPHASERTQVGTPVRIDKPASKVWITVQLSELGALQGKGTGELGPSPPT